MKIKYLGLIALLVTQAFAAQPISFTYQGKALNAAGTSPLLTTASFNLSITDPSGACLLYQETQSGINLTTTNGIFALQVGSNPADPKRTASDPQLTMSTVFANAGTQIVAASGACSSGYTPAVGDPRKLHVIITPSSGTPITISPDLSINAVPNSMVSDTVQGYTPIQLLTPVGTLISSLLTTCPSGYVLANGQSLLKTGYANLFAAIGTTYGSTTTTFDVPDTRGYFLRGLDTTGSVDTTAGRTLGSTEGQLTAVNGIRDTGHNHSATLYGLGGSGFQFTGQGAGGPGGTGYTSTNSANLIGDAETRPKNFAVNYCIKY